MLSELSSTYRCVPSSLREVGLVEIFVQAVLVSSKGTLHKRVIISCGGVTHFQVINNVITVEFTLNILRRSGSFRIGKVSFLSCIGSCRIIWKGKEMSEINPTLRFFLNSDSVVSRHTLLLEPNFELLNIKMFKFRVSFLTA